jgi:hypothetical protein
MSGFVKLYQSILDSSIWLAEDHVRLVWLTMLAMADQHGNVIASIGGLAHRARVSREATEKALLVLGSADHDSKDPANEGRRIAPLEGGGWVVLNHGKYREIRTPHQVQTADRVARWRKRQKDRATVTGNDVTPGNPPEADPDPEAEADQEHPAGVTPIAPKRGRVVAWRRFPLGWSPTEAHRKLAADLRVNLEVELEKIRDFEFSRPRRDPDATFRTWLRTAAERQSSQRAGSGNVAADNIKRQLERVKMLEEKERKEAAAEGV